MRIWSKRLTSADIYAAAPRGAYVERCELHEGPRTRVFHVHLRGEDDGEHTRRPNPGSRDGARGTGEWAATYDEWGWFLAYLFFADANARANEYRGRADFHKQTQDKYRTIPAHKAPRTRGLG